MAASAFERGFSIGCAEPGVAVAELCKAAQLHADPRLKGWMADQSVNPIIQTLYDSMSVQPDTVFSKGDSKLRADRRHAARDQAATPSARESLDAGVAREVGIAKRRAARESATAALPIRFTDPAGERISPLTDNLSDDLVAKMKRDMAAAEERLNTDQREVAQGSALAKERVARTAHISKGRAKAFDPGPVSKSIGNVQVAKGTPAPEGARPAMRHPDVGAAKADPLGAALKSDEIAAKDKAFFERPLTASSGVRDLAAPSAQTSMLERVKTPAGLAALAAALGLGGAGIGALTSDDPEKKRRNALIGGGLGAGAGALPLLMAMMKERQVA